MQRTIAVKGVGTARVKPDYVVLSLTLESKDMNYEKAMELSATHIHQIKDSLESVGFEKDSVKTTDFNVRSTHRTRKDRNGDLYEAFTGYEVTHRLKVSFDLDNRRLVQVLGVIANCPAQPRFSIGFTVKDAAAVSEELLVSAAQNARQKAQLLSAASGVKLGDLLSINYDWAELQIMSRTKYNSADDDVLECPRLFGSNDIEPDDIDVSDTVSFLWAIG